MAINECTEHQNPATCRCPVCLKPLCHVCIFRDGTCSERCFERRQTFGVGTHSTVQRRSTLVSDLIGWAIKLAILVGIAVGLDRAGYLPFKLPF